MSCYLDAACTLGFCGSNCRMECESTHCRIEECGSDCEIGCYHGRNCSIGKCTSGGCALDQMGSGLGPTKLSIDDCSGGNCTIWCAPYATCSIGACAGGGCTITCNSGASCTCGDSGCTVVDVP